MGNQSSLIMFGYTFSGALPVDRKYEVGMKQVKEYLTIAMAYVGVIVGAGLSSGQDLLQYFLAFGRQGIIGIVLLIGLNVIFGKIVITLGSYFQSRSHSEVLQAIASPLASRIIDWTLIISSFVVGFVMIAGAGSNLEQQFGLPSWLGALICAGLIVMVTFLDFNKITKILGIFTPIVIVMMIIMTIVSIIQKPLDLYTLDQAAESLQAPMPNVWLSGVNYFSLCLMTGVSMGFILGGSIPSIRSAEKGGIWGGALVGLLIACAYLCLMLNASRAVHSDMPMLEIASGISPLFSLIYALVIFSLIFNTAFSLFYGLASRFAKGDERKMRIYMIGLVAGGYLLSFGGFSSLIAMVYPVLGYMGFVLIAILALAWVRGRQKIIKEKKTRAKLFRLAAAEADGKLSLQEKKTFKQLCIQSAAGTRRIEQAVRNYARQALQPSNPDSVLS